ncbi:MAG: hypothetical protein MI923_27545 [Phycisphaerales bacterium]|nr:hypothetical protein [Phycisphaerales bacterium]
MARAASRQEAAGVQTVEASIYPGEVHSSIWLGKASLAFRVRYSTLRRYYADCQFPDRSNDAMNRESVQNESMPSTSLTAY